MPDNTPQPKAGQFLPGQSKVEQTSPSPSDKLLTDFIANNAADYLNLVAGEAHPDFTNQPGMRVVKQQPINWQLAARIYANDQAPIEDTYNASISYSGESVAHPIFTRDYIVRRTEYTARAKFSALRCVIGVKVTAGGSGYSRETVAVTATGGAGAGFAATAIVSNGAVIGVAITNEGDGYTAAPTIAITGGTGATATASIQPATALLVKEDVLRQQDQSTDSLYFLVRCIYETIPGPTLTGQEWNRSLDIISPFTRTITAAGTGAGNAATQIEPISAVKQQNTVWGVVNIQAQLDAYHLASPTNVRGLRLPEVLKSLTTVYNSDTGTGSSDTDPTGSAVGTSISLSLSDHSHSQGSAGLSPELIPGRKSWATENQPPGVNHVFFVPDNSTRAEVIAILSALMGRAVTSIVAGVATTAPAANGTVGHKLALNQQFKFATVAGGSGGIATNTIYYVKAIPSITTFTYSATSGGSALTGQAATSAVTVIPINDLPLWQKEAHTFIGLGGKVSVSADASAQQMVTLRDSETAYVRTNGSGTSEEIGLVNRIWDYPPMIHDAININDAANPGTLDATAEAHASTNITPNTNWPDQSPVTALASKSITGSVTPASISATSPITWPSVGLYITEFETEAYELERSHALIQLLDFATIPAP